MAPGKWARGFWFDSLHPNAAGHVEITRTFVPTLFEALERGGRTAVFESATLTPGAAFVSGVVIDQGQWAYRSATGRLIRSDVRADGAWHQILLSHYTARGQTLLFVDGKPSGSLDERLEPTRLALGGTTAFDAEPGVNRVIE